MLNKPTPIKKELHRRIIEIARRQNYVPNSTARTMVTGRTDNILLVIQRSFLDTLHETFFQELLLYLTALFTRRNLGLMLYASEENNIEELRRAILSRRADGILWYLSEIPEEIRTTLLERACPTVLVLNRDDKLSYVRYDDYTVERELMESVYNAGHRNIAFYGIWESDRRRAYTDMLRTHGLGYERYFSHFGNDYLSVRNGLRAELADKPVDFTCICADKDLSAINIINVFAELGIKVPDEVSVTGYDNISEAAGYNLTTVSQDYRRLCDEAVDCLAELIEHPEEGRIEKVLTGAVIPRGTLKTLA